MHKSGRSRAKGILFLFYLLDVNNASETWNRKKQNPAED